MHDSLTELGSGHRLRQRPIKCGDSLSLQCDTLLSHGHANHTTTPARSVCYQLSLAQPGCPVWSEKTMR